MKLIFDIDNTLIPIRSNWPLEYYDVLKEAGFEASEELALELFKVIGQYDTVATLYDKEELLKFVNDKCHKNYNMQLIDGVLDCISNNWINEEDKKISELLEYLSKNHELYVLTNWFTSSALKRLNNLGLDKFFKKIIGGDIYGTKPNLVAYTFFKDYNNCVMIGDIPEIDLKGAKELGMKTILIDSKGKYPDYEGIKIKDLNELKDILEKI